MHRFVSLTRQPFIKTILVTLFALSVSTALNGFVYDNRYLPVYPTPFWFHDQTKPIFSCTAFYAQTSEAYSNQDDQNNSAIHDGETTGLFNISGHYDQRILDNALAVSGRTTAPIIPPDLPVFGPIPWGLPGNAQWGGVGIFFNIPLIHNFLFGANTFVAHESSGIQQWLMYHAPNNQPALSTGDRQELIILNNSIHVLDQAGPSISSKTGMGDIDCYLKYMSNNPYSYKCRVVDAAITVGTLIPTAARRNIYNPSAFDFGGNGHWGMYGALSIDAELKEDLRTGILVRLSKRFPRIDCVRVPALTEPTIYGAIIGSARVDPGVTFIGRAYVQLGAIRNGFGLGCGYTIVYHDEDSIHDARTSQTVPMNRELAEHRSSWCAETIGVGAWYDYGYYHDMKEHAPAILLSVDIPVNLLGAQRVNKVYRVSLTGELII
jgi:hypothetical protein